MLNRGKALVSMLEFVFSLGTFTKRQWKLALQVYRDGKQQCRLCPGVGCGQLVRGGSQNRDNGVVPLD